MFLKSEYTFSPCCVWILLFNQWDQNLTLVKRLIVLGVKMMTLNNSLSRSPLFNGVAMLIGKRRCEYL